MRKWTTDHAGQTADLEGQERCTPPSALTAVQTHRCRSSPQRAGQCTAKSVTRSTGRQEGTRPQRFKAFESAL